MRRIKPRIYFTEPVAELGSLSFALFSLAFSREIVSLLPIQSLRYTDNSCWHRRVYSQNSIENYSLRLRDLLFRWDKIIICILIDKKLGEHWISIIIDISLIFDLLTFSKFTNEWKRYFLRFFFIDYQFCVCDPNMMPKFNSIATR